MGLFTVGVPKKNVQLSRLQSPTLNFLFDLDDKNYGILLYANR
jgi:hypothetical protein